MAGNVTGLNVFQDAISPEPLVKLDQNFNALQTALNTLNTFSNFLVDTGTPNNLNVTAGSTQYASYSDGLQVLVRIGNTNTGPSTLNINNMGPKQIIFPNESALTANALLAGSIQVFVYNASLNAFQLIGISGGALTVNAPLHVTNVSGQAALAINADGTGYIGDFNGSGLSWDGSGDFVFACGTNLRVSPPLAVMDPATNCQTGLFEIQKDGTVQMFPQGQGHNSDLMNFGSPNCDSVEVWSGANTEPGWWIASFHTAQPGQGGSPIAPPGVIGPPAIGCSNGVEIEAGTNASDTSFLVMPQGTTTGQPNNYFKLVGDGSGSLGPYPNQLVWNTAGHFTLTGTATLPPGASISSIGDVTITNPQNGQSLIYNAATQTWINSTPVSFLEQLVNVHVAGPAPGQVLTYSVNPQPGWVNATIPGYSFLTSLSIAGPPQAGYVLTWDGNAWVGASPGQVAQFPLTSLTDVAISGPINRQVLTWDAPNSKWINAPAPSPSLSTLPDVSLTAQSQGQVLAWDNTLHRWINSSLPGGSVIALDTLMDTNISDPQDNQVLTWDYASSRWVNRAPAIAALATLPDVTIASASAGQILTYDGSHWVNRGYVGPNSTNNLGWTTGGNFQFNPPQTGGTVMVYGNTGQAIFAAQCIGGTNNPSFNIVPTEAAGGKVQLQFSGTAIPAIGSIAMATRDIMTFANQGNVTINAPISGVPLTVWGEILQNSAGAVLSITPDPTSGANGVTFATSFAVGGSGPIKLAPGGHLAMSIAPAGTVTILPPTSGYPLTVQGAVGNGTLATFQNTSPASLINTSRIALGVANTFSGMEYAGIVAVSENTANQQVGLALETTQAGGGMAARVSISSLGVIHFAYLPSLTSIGTLGVDSGNQLTFISSTRSLKANIRGLARDKALSVVKRLRAVTFNSRCEGENQTTDFYGLIAEDVAEIDPGLVSLDKDGNPRGVLYDRVLLMLLPLMQEILGMDEPEGEVYG